MASDLPHVPRRPTRAKLADSHRNSNVVRASVLETALELGIGHNSTVADWIFNNPLSEEAEEFHPEPHNHSRIDTKSEPAPEVTEATMPTYTSGSNSTSDESSSLNSPGNNAPSAAVTTIQFHMHKPSLTESPHVHFGDFSSDQLQLFSPFALSPHNALHGETSVNSLANPARDNERSRSQDDSLPSHETPSPGFADAGYTSEGQYLSKGKASKSKDKIGKSKGNKGSRPRVTDNEKTSEKDVDYASDGGYLSASSNKSQGKSPSRVKSRAMAFFRRRTKKSVSDDEDDDSVPPVPALPILPRPSSPKLLERRTAPAPPTRSGFSPLTLNLTNPSASPPRRRVSKTPPPVLAQATLPRSDHISSLVASTSAPTVLTPSTAAATIPLPPSMPGTPLSTASFPTSSTPKSLTNSSSRQHYSLPPPAPPPTLPLPHPPHSSSIPSDGMLAPLPATPSIQSRRRTSTRPIPVVPPSPGSTQPLTPRGTASPFRPLLSPRSLPPAVSPTRNGEVRNGFEDDHSKEFTGRQRSVTAHSAGLGGTPAFLQRRIQHGPPPSPRRPLPDAPHPRTPIGSPSKFHEHFSSISSVPLSQILSTSTSMSPSPSTITLSESSSGPSARSSHTSSVSGRGEEFAVGDLLNALDYSRPTTSASTISKSSYGQPTTSTSSGPTMDHQSHFSGQSDISSSIYSRQTHRDSSSVTTYDGDDVEGAASTSCVDDEDDASVYPSDDKTAGRRTMYLVEHGELGQSEDEIVIAGSHYWGDHVPPLPPLPLMPTRPGPGYF